MTSNTYFSEGCVFVEGHQIPFSLNALGINSQDILGKVIAGQKVYVFPIVIFNVKIPVDVHQKPFIIFDYPFYLLCVNQLTDEFTEINYVLTNSDANHVGLKRSNYD